MELRLYLASLAATSTEVERVASMIMTMAAADPGAGAITFVEWAVGWGWVRHAFRIYGLPMTEAKTCKY